MNLPQQQIVLRGLRAPSTGCWGAVFWLSVVFLLILPVSAQTTVKGRPCEGQNGFVVKDSGGRTVSRGWTTSKGTLPEGLVLGANQTYSMTVANGGTRTIGSTTFKTGDNGSTLTLPPTQVGDSISPDTDGDDVPDDIEDVFGTDPKNPSTVGGGLGDKLLVTTPPPAGTTSSGPGLPTNPAFGPPGIINTVSIPGNCVDVFTFNDTVALACLDRGVTLFNIFGGLSPRQIAVVDTPGEARAVSGEGNLVLVGDGFEGLGIIDMTDPAAAFLRNSLKLGGYAGSVAAAGGTAYVGLRNRQLVVVDLASAVEIQRLNTNGDVYDVYVSGGFVWAVCGDELTAFEVDDGFLSLIGRVTLNGLGPDPFSGRKRLFVAGGFAQVTCLNGFENYDVRNPRNIVRLGAVPSSGTPGSFKQIVSNGSGLGVAAVGVNPREDGTHDIYLYNLGVPSNVSDLSTILATPGNAFAVSLYNGLAYVADGVRGLQVLRYMETDRMGMPPIVNLETGAVDGEVEEGKLLRFTANASDDLQVRNVEFFVDGQPVAMDANYPFEGFFRVPLSTPARSTFTAGARAFDTGGNSTLSAPVLIRIGPDRTAPRVVRTQPSPNSIFGGFNAALAFFSEPIRPDTVNLESFRLINAGQDGVFGTGDDLVPTGGTLSYQESLKAAVWSFPNPLPAGVWQGIISPPLSDSRGMTISEPYRWIFVVFDKPDRDHDGVPDDMELLLGSLNPDNPDSKRDGVRDGDRDFDLDGLSNSAEVVIGANPTVKDSDGDGTLDGAEDSDGDGLLDGKEASFGTNLLAPDTDGDKWNDEAEGTSGSIPTDRQSTPQLFVVGYPEVKLALPLLSRDGSMAGFFAAQPPVHLALPGLDSVSLGMIIGRPPVMLALPALGNSEASLGTVIGQPPVEIFINPQ